MISTRWFEIGFRTVATQRPDGGFYTTYAFHVRIYLRPWRRYA